MQYKNFKINEAFNDCPGGEVIKSDLAKYNLEKAVQFTDAVADDNDTATMVFEFTGSTREALRLAKLSTEWFVDEFDTYHRDGKTIVRMWWD